MRRLAAASGILLAAILAGVIVARAGPEHDTTRDGVVDLRDALDVLSHFGEAPQPGTPTPVPALRETHIVVTEPRHSLNWNLDVNQQASWRTILVPIDVEAYPPQTLFSLWATMHSDFGGEICVRLTDATNGFPATPIAGAIACTASATPQGAFSPSFTLPRSVEILSIEALPAPGQNGTLASARVIASVSN